ncbi:lipoprotein [Lentzea sp. NBRC 105346]|nr:lipoprotein [Lentzea sp. NBRC 105346]
MPAVAPAQGDRAQENSGNSNSKVSAEQVERQLIRTATVDLHVDDVDKAIAEIKGKAANAGGFSGQENATKSYANVTVKVPSKELDRILEELGKVGDVTKREVRSEDVTEQVADVEGRLASQRASVERVRALFEKASSTSEITQIEAELNKRQQELESLQRRYDSLKGQVAMATLTVNVSPKGAAPPPVEETGFLSALAAGWNALTTGLGWIVIAIGAVLPFAVVIGGPVLAVIFVARRRRRVTQSSEAA